MDDSQDEKRFLRRVALAAGVVVLLLALWTAREAILIAFAAVLVAVLLDAAADAIAARTPISRRWALPVAGLLILAGLALAFGLIGAQVAAQVAVLAERLPEAVAALEGRLGIRLPDGAEALPQGVLGQVAGFGRAVVDALSALLLAVVGGFFLASDPGRYRKGLVKLFPKADTARVWDMLDTLAVALRRWLVATLAAMAIVGTAAGVACWLIGLPAPLALGLFAGIAQFVPVVGAVLGAVPAVLIAASQGGVAVLWTLAAFLLIQQVESNMITPVVEERLVNIPAFVLLVGIVAAGALLGLPGVALAAPLTVVIYVAIQKLYVRETLGRGVTVAGEGE